MGAIAQTLLSLTKQGDHVVYFIETYNPSRYLIRRLLGRFGVSHTLLSIEDLAGVERTLKARPTRLVFFESPTNPVTKIADIGALTRLARAAGALSVLDNTFAGFHQHGRYDVDMFVHSLTKYASGAGDVMGGAVIARAELIRALRADFAALGGTLDPHAAFLILRGLKTYFVRYRAQCASAALIAQLLADHPAVARVHYPGLPTHPQHALAALQMQDFGTIVELRPAGRRGRGAALRRHARTVCARRQPRIHRVAGGDVADDGQGGAECGAAAHLRRHRRHHTAVDRAGGQRQPPRRHPPRARRRRRVLKAANAQLQAQPRLRPPQRLQLLSLDVAARI